MRCKSGLLPPCLTDADSTDLRQTCSNQPRVVLDAADSAFAPQAELTDRGQWQPYLATLSPAVRDKMLAMLQHG